MLSSITPLGERGRGNRWWLTVAAYTVGSVLAGALVGTVAGAIGSVLPVSSPMALGVLGVVTIVTTSTVYLTWLACLLVGSPSAGAAIGAVFGAARALPVLATRRVTTTGALAHQHRRIDALAPRLDRLAVAAQVGAAGVSLAILAVVGG